MDAFEKLLQALKQQASDPQKGIVMAVAEPQQTCQIQVGTEILQDVPYYGPVTPASGMEAIVLFRDAQASRPAAIAFRSATPAFAVSPTGQVQIGAIADTLGAIITELLTALETTTAGGDPLSSAASIGALKSRVAAVLV